MTLSDHMRAALVRRVVARSEAIPGGTARGMSPSDFDAKELAKGITVEQEHLVGGGYSAEEARAKATEIAMDHLAEIPDYYTRLLKMESEAEGQSKHAAGEAHAKSLALMKFLSKITKSLGSKVGEHVYVVGGAVRDFVLDRPIKDVDVVVDSVALGRDSEWFARQVERAIPVQTNFVTNQYGVVLMKVLDDWVLDGLNMRGEEIEIANARKESYGGDEGKGYKPHMVEPATIEEDVLRRELTYNTLLLRLLDLANGPDKKDIVDLTGCGLKDLEEGRMQCPRDPDVVFSDDPSRMIRVIKYALRYGHKMTPDTLAAIRRNAGKIANIPSSHLAQMLTQIVLTEKTWKQALAMMDHLDLLDPVRGILLTDRSFRSTLENYVNSQKMDMLFGLLDVGLPLGAGIGFLDGREQTRLREITLGMGRDEAWDFAGMLKNPGNAWKDKKFMPELAREFGFLGKGMATFAPEVSRIGRELLLDQPELAKDPVRLKRLVREQVGRVAPRLQRTAGHKTAKLIKTLWLVTDPTPDAEIIDILVGLSDWGRLRNVMVGSGPRWSKDRPAFHDDFKSAYADAMTRLRKVHGRDIPDWVLANGGSEGTFRMASRVAAMSRVPEGTLPGFARDIDDRDLKRLRIRWPYSGRGRSGAPTLETTAAHETKAEALREAEQYAKSYEKRTWPGGMASVVAVIEFPDQPNDDESGGVWVAVTNTYYSPS